MSKTSTLEKRLTFYVIVNGITVGTVKGFTRKSARIIAKGKFPGTIELQPKFADAGSVS